MKPNFFCGIEGLQWLLQNEPASKRDDIDLTVDLIEAPYLFIYTSDADAWNLKVMGRGEIYDHEKGSGIERGNLRVDRKTGEGAGQTSDPLLRDNMGAFFEACRRLARYIRDENLQPLYAGLDPEQAGVMLEVSGGKLTARKVAGKDRPEMMCTTLFGGPTMCRPYMEDFWDRSETDMMSLEEKIEKAEGGDKFAMAKLAQAYLNGDDEVEQDPAKAAYWFRKEAELQDSEGAFNLGLMYAKGFGVERDFAQAAEWMEKAVAWGDSDGAAPAKQYRTMAENLKKAGAGDAAAMAEVAGTYMAMAGSLTQAGTDGDYAESVKWAQKAADAGCAAGYWPLALAYEHGRGVKKNDRKAVELYKKGADLGHAACQHSYGCRLMTGEGAKKDVKQALALFERSAAQGYGLAYQALGRMYETGKGVEPDFDKEMEYYEKACEALPNNAEFLRHVGYQYVNLMDGNEAGWLRAVKRASYWLHKAADLGDRTAMGGADTFDRILELHRQGKIPAGSGMDKCMAYLEGKTPAKKNGGRPQAKQPSKARTGAAAPAVKTQKDDGQARKKGEEEAKTIHDAVRRAWDEGLSAKRAYDRCTTEVNIKTSRALDYFSDDFESKLSEIVELSLDACRDLFDVCQAQVCTVDRICRPLLNSTRSYSEIKKVADVIRWLNETSVIEKQFDLSVNSTELGNVSEVKLAPEQKCIDIQRFWEETLLKMPRPPMEGPKEQEKRKTEKERKPQETTVKRSGAEPAKPVQKGQQEAQSSPQNEAEQLTPTQRWAREQAEQLKKRQQSAQNGPQKETEQLTPAQRWAREQAEELRKRRQEAESSKQKEAERKAAEEERQREEERKKEEARQIEAEKRREAERKKAEAERIEAEKKLEKARKKRERKRLIGIALTAAGALVSLAGIVMGTEYGKWLLLLFPGAYLLWFGLKLLYSL